MVAGGALMLYFSRGLIFSIDELVWFAESPGLDLRTSLEPHAGHLTFTSRVVYWAVFELFGSGYLPFRILSVAAILAAVGLFFIFARRRVGGLIALAPCLVLIVFGSDPSHSLYGNGFTVVGALACGIGALLAVERGDWRGDLGACFLLCLGVATYTVALPFVVGVGVYLSLRSSRWLRLWVAALPFVLYVVWWLWSRNMVASGASATELTNLLLIPATAFQACATLLGALSGLDYPFSETTAQAGPALALLVIAGLGWRLARGKVPDSLWALLVIPAVLWGLISIAKYRLPDNSRYLFPSAIAVLLVAAEAARGVRCTRSALMAIYGVAAVGAATNVALLKDAGGSGREVYVPLARAELAALEIAGPGIDPRRDAEAVLFPTFDQLGATGKSPAAAYLEAAHRYGMLGFATGDLAAQSDRVRSRTDQHLVAALAVGLEPQVGKGPVADSLPGAKSCRTVGGVRSGAEATVDLQARGIILSTVGLGGVVGVRRFAPEPIPVGDLSTGVPAALRLPGGGKGRQWKLEITAIPLRLCELR